MMPKTKLFTSILVGIILFIRLFDLYYTPLYNPDKLEQLIAAKNWAEGHGVSRASYVMKDTLTLEFAPLVQWPPGYSLVTGLLMNSRISIHTIVTLVDGLTLLLFALFSIVFIQSLHFEWKHSAWILWIVIMLNTSLSWQLTSVDFISITLFWGAITLILPTDNQAGRFSGILAGLFWGLCFWFRYAYIPQVLALIAIGGVYQWIFQRETFWKAWIPAGLVSAIFLILFWIFVKTGNPGYIDEANKSLYLSNLLKFNWRFISDSFSSLSGLERVFSNRLPIVTTLLMVVFSLLLTFILVRIILFAKKSRFAWIILYSIILVNILLLLYLSLTNAPQNWAKDGWTFVQENRYYAPTWVAVWMLVIWYLSIQKSAKFEKLILIPVLIFVLTESAAYRRWRYTNLSFTNREELPTMPDYAELKRIAKIAENYDLIPMQITADPYTGLVAELAGWLPAKNLNKLPENACLLQYPDSEEKLGNSHMLSLELYLKSGKIIYLINPPHLWN
jgi:hypothetical protein